MPTRDYVYWIEPGTTNGTSSYYVLNTAYCPQTTTSSINIDCADYCIKWFREEENEDTEEWEHLLEEGEK